MIGMRKRRPRLTSIHNQPSWRGVEFVVSRGGFFCLGEVE